MMNTYAAVIKTKKSFLFIAFFFMVSFAIAQKPMKQRPFEINLEKDEKIETEFKNNMSVNTKTGFPVALYGLKFSVKGTSPKEKALDYLKSNYKVLGIPYDDIPNLVHHATRSSNAGDVVRFRQYTNSGIPVNKAEVTITISKENKVVLVMNGYLQGVDISNAQKTVTKERAFVLARNYINPKQAISYTNNSLLVYKNNKMTRLAHKVIISTTDPLGEWHVYVDATNEEIFKVVDKNHYHKGKEKGKEKKDKAKNVIDKTDSENNTSMMMATGNGMIFDPDPLSSNQVSYGGGYVDNNDANSPELNNARVSVTLNDITLSGSTYSLVGPRAEIVDFDAPSTGLFTQNSPNFNFTRQDQGFEPVNCYYHIDYMMDYINNTLGCNVVPYQYNGGVRFDPHGSNGADNSYYTSAGGRLSFGEGCVDDGEDSDVIHHELGHGLHDWVTSGGLSQVDGLSEGCGDYVAQSYNRGLGYWNSTDAAYNWVFNWDGHNACWNGRITNYTAAYPGGLVGQIHTDGQIWASCLMTVWDQIGQQRMDKIFYEGLGMTNGTSSQNDAANAVYQAAINLNYTNTELVAIHSGLTACGYTLPALPGPPVAAFSADNTTICLGNGGVANFTDESTSAPAATAWAWTFEGGSPGTSSQQNPTVTYSAVGTYDVTLQVTNANGTDTIILTDYITVVSGTNCTSCSTQASATNLNLSIPDGAGSNTAGQPLTHIITVPSGSDVTIDDLTVNVDISHTYINDLVITLTHPNGTTTATLWDRECGGENNLDVTFDDDAGAITCAQPTTGIYAPASPLTVFDGLTSAGDWTLTVVDWWSQDTGNINDWSMEICGVPVLSVEENNIYGFSIYPNPNDGSFVIRSGFNFIEPVEVKIYDISGRSLFNTTYGTNSLSSFEKSISLDVQSGMYFVEIISNDIKTIKKIIID